ncbi:hypothetical protein DFP72DRAFT_1109529 [Ephemerocybe angulata]|uniref:Uncharacterized protein n=1 Tax=Ephemerocybe angulata TaxID=980116 RepID=A0A8H6I3E2_9AGAR|nr:hypothetical protein DFP72DRAFT_1109529 [Tulosesus angulatus]
MALLWYRRSKRAILSLLYWYTEALFGPRKLGGSTNAVAKYEELPVPKPRRSIAQIPPLRSLSTMNFIFPDPTSPSFFPKHAEPMIEDFEDTDGTQDGGTSVSANVVAQRLAQFISFYRRVRDAMRLMEFEAVVVRDRKALEAKYSKLADAKLRVSVILPQLELLAQEIEALEIVDDPKDDLNANGGKGNKGAGAPPLSAEEISSDEVRKLQRLEDIVDDDTIQFFKDLEDSNIIDKAPPNLETLRSVTLKYLELVRDGTDENVSPVESAEEASSSSTNLPTRSGVLSLPCPDIMAQTLKFEGMAMGPVEHRSGCPCYQCHIESDACGSGAGVQHAGSSGLAPVPEEEEEDNGDQSDEVDSEGNDSQSDGSLTPTLRGSMPLSAISLPDPNCNRHQFPAKVAAQSKASSRAGKFEMASPLPASAPVLVVVERVREYLGYEKRVDSAIEAIERDSRRGLHLTARREMLLEAKKRLSTIVPKLELLLYDLDILQNNHRSSAHGTNPMSIIGLVSLEETKRLNDILDEDTLAYFWILKSFGALDVERHEAKDEPKSGIPGLSI